MTTPSGENNKKKKNNKRFFGTLLRVKEQLHM